MTEPAISHNQPQALPILRQDLQLLPAAPEHSGKPGWVIHDPACNRYYKMGRQAFEILRRWHGGISALELSSILAEAGVDSSPEEIETVARFLTSNQLVKASSPEAIQRLYTAALKRRQGVWRWILQNYVFFRIPLFRPDRFLEKTLPLTNPLFGSWCWPVILLLGMAGLFLAGRQWDSFLNTFLYFFDVKGLIIFALTTVVVKTLHELGHAYTAKRYGCKVPVMGVAFIVLYPMLYTDTTDAWRLPSHRKRMHIATAGMKTEVGIAALSLCAWGLLPDGILRSSAWFLASVSWVSSLIVNLSPLMRFDGYYVLADWLGEENLQPRSFAFARWHLRESLFGLGERSPEALTRDRARFFVCYAWAVWVYRMVVFFGIALIVYHLFFKALGVVLFTVEIWWFILLPIWRETMVWWSKRAGMQLSFRMLLVLFLALFPVVLLFVPWQSSIVLPGVWKASKQSLLFAPEAGRLEYMLVESGDSVTPGQPLFVIHAPEVEQGQAELDIERDLLERLYQRHVGSARDLEALSVIKMRQAEMVVRQRALEERRARMTVRAPFSGVVEVPGQHRPGDWVARENSLLSVVSTDPGQVVAYVEEENLHRIAPGAEGGFLSTAGEDGHFRLRLTDIAETAVAQIPEPFLASTYHGPVAVRESVSGELVPEKAQYRLEFAVERPGGRPHRQHVGVVRLKGQKKSVAGRLFNTAAAVLIREFSF